MGRSQRSRRRRGCVKQCLAPAAADQTIRTDPRRDFGCANGDKKRHPGQSQDQVHRLQPDTERRQGSWGACAEVLGGRGVGHGVWG